MREAMRRNSAQRTPWRGTRPGASLPPAIDVRAHTVRGGGGVRLHVVEAGAPAGQAILFIVGWSYGGFIVNDYLRVYGDEGIGAINYVGAGADLGVPTEYKGLGPVLTGLLPGEDG